MNPPYLFSGELCTSPLHCKLVFVYTVFCRRTGQCFSVLRTRNSDVVDSSSGRSYVTEQGHNVPLLRTRALEPGKRTAVFRSECSVKSPRLAYPVQPPSRGVNTVLVWPVLVCSFVIRYQRGSYETSCMNVLPVKWRDESPSFYLQFVLEQSHDSM